MENLSIFGERLSELLFDKNITNKEFATEINVHVTTVQRWKRNSKYVFLSQLLNIVNYLNCSIDFITGRSETIIDYTPNECPPFYEQFRKVLKEKSVSRYRMDKDTKIKDSYFTQWKNGKEPHLLSLIEIANYLDISIDYLVGREK